MGCYYCGKELQFRYRSELCDTCTFDKTIIISFTEAKRKYVLRNEDFDDLFCIEFYFLSTLCRKFIIDEVEEKANELTKGMSSNSYKRRCYLKQKAINDKIRAKRSKIKDRKNKIIKDLEIITQKIGTKFKLRDYYQVNKLVNTCAENVSMSVIEASTFIYNKLYKEFSNRIDREKRLLFFVENGLRKRLNTSFKKRYTDTAKRSKDFFTYVRHGFCYSDINRSYKHYSIEKVCSKIVDDIYKSIGKDKRIKKIDDKLQSMNYKVSYHRKNYFYKKYINREIKFEEAINGICRKNVYPVKFED